MSMIVEQRAAVLFADIVGSTRLFVELGDDKARELVSECLAYWSRLVEFNEGRVIQLRGDGMLCIFPSADRAVTAAIMLRDAQRGRELSMHAGVHVGRLLAEEDQLYGDTVNTAARVAELAKADEILVTRDTIDQLTMRGEFVARQIGEVAVKGQNLPIEIYSMTLQGSQVTGYVAPVQTRLSSNMLVIRYRSAEVAISDECADVVIGRDDGCGLVIAHRLASRRHATLVCKLGKFFLEDHSTNGTYVQQEGARKAVPLRRELVQLGGRGIITVGAAPDADSGHRIEYSEEAQGAAQE